jgi:hypothetical protein
MQEWVSEPSLAGVREALGLAGLPAEERRLWQAFWADVAAARTKDLKAPEPPASQPARTEKEFSPGAAHVCPQRGTGK